MTLREALSAATTQLATSEHLRDNASRDAELLFLNSLQITRTQLLTHPDRILSEDEITRYQSLITRRLTHEPIQYITGQQEFYGLDLRVTPAVLIPRPETEHLVETVLRLLPHDQPLKIADIGTGSGAIAIALAIHLPLAQITALDLSPDALRIAEANAHDHSLSNRIRFLQSDLLSALARDEAINEIFDAIVSNPPYIPNSDLAELHPQVRSYEPHTALFAGSQGLDVYSRLIPEARTALKPNGLLALEIGHGQRDALASLLGGWQDVDFVDDLQGIPRVAIARKP